jgi:hypothetical protein
VRFSRRRVWRWLSSGLLRRVVGEIALMMKAARISETSVNFYQTTAQQSRRQQSCHSEQIWKWSNICVLFAAWEWKLAAISVYALASSAATAHNVAQLKALLCCVLYTITAIILVDILIGFGLKPSHERSSAIKFRVMRSQCTTKWPTGSKRFNLVCICVYHWGGGGTHSTSWSVLIRPTKLC